jgi:hypothetical protein
VLSGAATHLTKVIFAVCIGFDNRERPKYSRLSVIKSLEKLSKIFAHILNRAKSLLQSYLNQSYLFQATRPIEKLSTTN